MDRRSALVAIAGAAGALALPDAAWSAASSGPSLDAIARSRGLRFGTATDPDEIVQPDLASLIAAECSVLVAENAFKWKSIENQEGKVRLDGARAVAKYANANRMLLRGHTMLWNQDNRISQFLIEKEKSLGKGKASAAAKVLETHIRRMVAWFPAVQSWDVVNEVIELSSGSIRDALWARTLGEQMMDIAFAIARDAAPKTQLVYNDYMSWDANPKHRDGVLRLLEGAKKRGVPIDALGVQSHLAGSLNRKFDEAAWRRFLTEIEGLGLDILITELDCGDRNVLASDIAARDAKSADHMRRYLDLTLSFPRVKQVVLWGISDRGTYMNGPNYEPNRRRPDGTPQRGHPYDEQLAAKPMRAAIAAALANAPKR